MDWHLLFTGADSNGWVFLCITAVAICVGVCLWLARLERRIVGRRTAIVLTALRITTMLILLLTFFRPVLSRSWTVETAGRVVIAVDVSESMETSDRHALPGERLRWAQALGMLGGPEVDDLLKEWTDALEAGREPRWADDEQVAEQRRGQIAGILRDIGDLQRLEFVRRLLLSNDEKGLTNLQAAFPIEIRAFAEKQAVILPDRLSNVLESNRTDLNPFFTDAARVLEDSIGSQEDGRLRALVLVTDGRQTLNSSLDAQAARYRSLGIPVYTVPIGSRLAPSDLSVISIEAPGTVFLNDSAVVRANLGTAGFEGRDVTVRLRRDDQTMEEKTIRATTDIATVEFDLPADELGRREYQIETDSQPGELREDNNRRSFDLSVVDNQARVLLIDGDSRWEFRFLHNALDRDKQVDLQTVLFRQPWMGLLDQPFYEDGLPAPDEFRRQLAETDLLILGDVSPGDFTAPYWTAVDEAVSRDGMTLVVIPGPEYSGSQFTSVTARALLPVTNVRRRQAESYVRSRPGSVPSGFDLQVTPEGRDAAVLDLPPAAAADGRLPSFPVVYSGDPVPTAVIWANAQCGAREDARLPAIVRHYYGFGQVVWMGMDATWRWRQRANDSIHYRFWGQLVRWATGNRASAGNEQVRLTLSQPAADEGDSVTVLVRWGREQMRTGIPEGVRITIAPSEVNDSAKASSIGPRQIPLSTASEDSGRQTAELPSLPPGLYDITLEAADAGIVLRDPVTTSVLIKPRVSQELADVSCDRDRLQALAAETGGTLVEPFHFEQLAELLRPEAAEAEQSLEVSLWDHWSQLVLLFALLTAEWITRKYHGLP